MTSKEIVEKAVEIYFSDNCTVAEAVDKAQKELKISNTEFSQCFVKENNQNGKTA